MSDIDDTEPVVITGPAKPVYDGAPVYFHWNPPNAHSSGNTSDLVGQMREQLKNAQTLTLTWQPPAPTPKPEMVFTVTGKRAIYERYRKHGERRGVVRRRIAAIILDGDMTPAD